MLSLARHSARGALRAASLPAPISIARQAAIATASAKSGISARRAFHTDPMTGEPTGYNDIDASLAVVEKTDKPNQPPPPASLVFGHSFSDHMLSLKWNSTTGWSAPLIHPYGPLTLDPSSVIFHYAPCLFEGMKAYKDVQGRVRLFRPDMNMKRMNNSAERLALPKFDGEQLTRLIARLVATDQNFIPSEPGHSIYIRPTMIGTQAALGVHPTNEAMLFVILSPVGPYFKSGFKPVALLAETEAVRAWPGGSGKYKVGANYAITLQPQMQAIGKGYSQSLWLSGEEEKLTEVGTMNLFVLMKNEQGKPVLSTAPLNALVLPGVTRDSVLQLARDHASGKSPIEGLPADLIVSEHDLTMSQIDDAVKEGRMMEMFGSGTAVGVSPVNRIGYRGRDIHIPVSEEGIGPVAKGLLKQITDIQLGKIDHPWSVVVDDLI